jgi:hypothetical protein
MEAQPREIRRNVTLEGKVPFADWLNSLRDRTRQNYYREKTQPS